MDPITEIIRLGYVNLAWRTVTSALILLSVLSVRLAIIFQFSMIVRAWMRISFFSAPSQTCQHLPPTSPRSPLWSTWAQA